MMGKVENFRDTWHTTNYKYTMSVRLDHWISTFATNLPGSWHMDSPTFDSQEADRLSSIRSPHRMACSCNWESPGSMFASWQKCPSPFASSPKRAAPRWCTKTTEGPFKTRQANRNITHHKFMDEYPEEKKPLGFPSGCHPICGEQIKLQKWRASTAPKMLLASTRISMTSMGNSTAHLWWNWCEQSTNQLGTSWKP